jgi:hypothetical protein
MTKLLNQEDRNLGIFLCRQDLPKWNDTPLNGTTGFGGRTDGPYFGLVERGQPSEPILTPSRWGLVTLAGLALAAGLAFISIRMRSAPLAPR